MSDNRDIIYALLGFGYGIWAFFYGFDRLRRKRLIENTPTSTVRGLAMGLVELEGVVRPATLKTSPLTTTECAIYKFKVEEYRSSGKSGSWVTVADGDSFYFPFYLDDGTGQIKVYPAHAEIFWDADYLFETGIGKDMPENLIRFLDENGIKRRDWFFAKKMRFTEWYIRDGDSIYVLGTAEADDEPAIRYDRDRLSKRLSQLKKDSRWLKKVDTDNDNNISREEWKIAVESVESELIGESMNEISMNNEHGIRICKDKDADPFIIARDKEWDLVETLSSKCMLCIWGGPVLSLATLMYLIWRWPMLWFLP